MRAFFIFQVCLFFTLTGSVYSQDKQFISEGLQISGPECLNFQGAGTKTCTLAEHERWLADVIHWRTERRIRIGYSSARYEDPLLKWTQSSFIQPQMMIEDRYFYNPVTHQYTVDRYLEDLEKRYGGIDAVLLWPTYPNMGIDNRNQHDMIRSLPGGIPGVKQMIADFHKRGVRVFFPMMMWDQGTRDPELPWTEAIAQLMAEIGADGINGDTQDGVPQAFIQASEKIGHPLVFEPEKGDPYDEAVAYNLITWGQNYKTPYPPVPLIDRSKWLEPRHMVHITDRWSKQKTDHLQFAFFNGCGFESWENIWGIWNGITPHDGEMLRRMVTIERAMAPFLVSQDWEPFFPMSNNGVFASRWPLGDKTLWTIVNRNENDITGNQMELTFQEGMRYFDLYHGNELTPVKNGNRVILNFDIEVKGFGCVLAIKGDPDSSILLLMSRMKELTTFPLKSFKTDPEVLTQQMVPIKKIRSTRHVPSGMIKIPTANFNFKVRGIEIEGSNAPGVDVQYPWEDLPHRFHEHSMTIKSFWIDKYPVTNDQFKKFLDAMHYHPVDDINFLRDWTNGSYPEGSANRPVTWISLDDARAYATWAGKRLPDEWEWQYAAQGTDGRLYPWGNSWNEKVVPIPDKSRTMRGPDPVDTHPDGASPFGVMDMVGNVWQWTNEFTDEHTRAAIIRGGSYYQPQGSAWYFPQAYKLDEHGKYLLMAPSKDRSGCIGFRCVQDAE
jgi:gamma-glutamyl hercynylcysteine S-oxide synthase